MNKNEFIILSTNLIAYELNSNAMKYQIILIYRIHIKNYTFKFFIKNAEIIKLKKIVNDIHN